MVKVADKLTPSIESDAYLLNLEPSFLEEEARSYLSYLSLYFRVVLRLLGRHQNRFYVNTCVVGPLLVIVQFLQDQ